MNQTVSTPAFLGKKIELCSRVHDSVQMHEKLVIVDGVEVHASAVDSFPNKTIPKEIHATQTQLILVANGTARVTVSSADSSIPSEKFIIHKTEMMVIPAGVAHKVEQVGDVPLKVASIYAQIPCAKK